MELQTVIEQRHSVRKYKSDPVPQNLLSQMVQLTSQAPSAGGLRAYNIIITEKQLTPYKSPSCFVVCALPEVSAKRYGDRGRQLYALQDATIAAAYLQLLAVDLGLSTVWVGAFREDKVKRELNLDNGLRPIAIIPVGYADD